MNPRVTVLVAIAIGGAIGALIRAGIAETVAFGDWPYVTLGVNLVGTILKNNGYTVHDLGRQVPVTSIIDAADEHGAVQIALAGGVAANRALLTPYLEHLLAIARRVGALPGKRAVALGDDSRCFVDAVCVFQRDRERRGRLVAGAGRMLGRRVGQSRSRGVPREAATFVQHG